MMVALGNRLRRSSMSFCVVGAEPIRTVRTEDRSVLAIVSFSRTIIASIVGTEVSQVTPKRPTASTYFFASNCGISTMLACAANTNFEVPRPFMWKSGAATISRWSPGGMVFRRDSTAHRCPWCESGTPLGRPVDPEVYSTIATSPWRGTTVSNGPRSSSASNSGPNSTIARSAATAGLRSASHSTSFTLESRITKSIVSRGNLWFTGTATRPARMVPKYAMRNSARLADRMATESPRTRPRRSRPRAQASARASTSPWVYSRGCVQSRQSISASLEGSLLRSRRSPRLVSIVSGR